MIPKGICFHISRDSHFNGKEVRPATLMGSNEGKQVPAFVVLASDGDIFLASLHWYFHEV